MSVYSCTNIFRSVRMTATEQVFSLRDSHFERKLEFNFHPSSLKSLRSISIPSIHHTILFNSATERNNASLRRRGAQSRGRRKETRRNTLATPTFFVVAGVRGCSSARVTLKQRAEIRAHWRMRSASGGAAGAIKRRRTRWRCIGDARKNSAACEWQVRQMRIYASTTTTTTKRRVIHWMREERESTLLYTLLPHYRAEHAFALCTT